MKNIKTSCSVSQRPQGFQAKPSALQPAFLIFTPKQETTVTGRQKQETAGQIMDYLQLNLQLKLKDGNKNSKRNTITSKQNVYNMAG